jgi:steroid delta-isomerase-like uncharacterized protein
VSQGDLDAQAEVYATDCVIHEPDEDVQGTEGLRQFVGRILATFPDMRVTVEDEVAEGDKVVTRWTGRGTHRDEFLVITPTGNRVEVTGITIHRIEGGKIAEEWEMPDNLGLMQQLGVIPLPERAGA